MIYIATAGTDADERAHVPPCVTTKTRGRERVGFGANQHKQAAIPNGRRRRCCCCVDCIQDLKTNFFYLTRRHAVAAIDQGYK